MKIFRVRTDTCWYDEFDSCVVVARDEDEALEVILNSGVWRSDGVYVEFTEEQFKDLNVDEITLDEPKLIVSAYNAG